MEDFTDNNTHISDPETDKVHINQEEASYIEPQVMESVMEVLRSIELDLAYSSEKLVNLHVLLMRLLAWDDDLEETAEENSYISPASIEKTLVFDLLCGILDSEVRELQNFVDSIQAEITNACHKVLSFRNSMEIFSVMEEKLHSFEKSLKMTQEHVVEVKMQSAKLRNTFSAFRLENWKEDQSMDLSANRQLLNMNAGSKRQKQKHILRMLEKSLGRELELEKKMSEQRQNEEQLSLKLHYTEQVAFRMEEAAEVVWGRFLEAENAAEVLMGTSKELVGRLQILQFNQNSSFQREAELKSKLLYCIQQLDAKDAALENLKHSMEEYITRSSEVPGLTEKVKSLEEQLKKSELLLMNANSINEENQEQLVEMENIVESLKESNYEAESRAETAEAKATQLTDTNMELNEEINFLKGSRDTDTKKVTLLEKQLRELEIQLQHAKASSEASQEQQNMLYSAIWDMETLIEDLKSKVSKAESKTESTEEQCIELSESNFELNRELNFLRARVEDLESSLDEVNKSKAASAKEINLRNRLIMDTVMQLAGERERIQVQLCSLAKENEALVQKLRNSTKKESVCNNPDADNDKLFTLENDPSKEACGKASEEAMSLCKSSEVDKNLKNGSLHEPEARNSYSTHGSNDGSAKLKTEKSGHLSLKAIFAILLAAAGVLVYLLQKKHFFHGYASG